MFKGGGKWSSNGCDGKKRSGGFIDVNGGVSKGGSLIVTHHDYSSNGYQGGNGTGGTGGGYSVGSYNSTFLSSYSGYGNSQGLGKLYEPEEVLGMSGHTKKNPSGDSETIDQIIEFSRRKSADCWGSNALNHGSGGKDAPQYIKAINLGGTDMHDRDSGNLFYVLRDFNFNLEILNLSNNRIGDLGVESMIYGITGLQYQTLYSAESGWKPYQSSIKTVQNVISINLSNNQISDKGAELLAHYLANGSLPSTKFIDVSGNQITSTGEGYFVNSLESLKKQDIAIILKKITETGNEAIKAAVDFTLKALKYSVQQFAKEQWELDKIKIDGCGGMGVNIGKGFIAGLIKCAPLEAPQAIFLCSLKEGAIQGLFEKETLQCIGDINDTLEKSDCSIF